MTDDFTANQTAHQPVARPPDLKRLDRLVGKWQLSGDVSGTVTYEWMDGGFFLLQHIDMQQQDGEQTTGLEVIGHLKGYGEEPSEDIHSRYYAGTGDTLDYVYEVEGDTLTIWFGERGSPAYYRAVFSEDDSTLDGAWHYPGGGGYKSNATRIS